MAENAIAQLEKAGHLFGGDIDDIRQSLHAAKYKGRGDKAERIIRARRKFYSEGDPQYQIGIETLVSDLQKEPSPQKRRQVLVKEVFGFSWKTASHFLRGVNLSENQLAILDVRVLGELLNLPELGLRASGLVRFDAKTNPKHPRKSEYMAIECRVKPWAERIGIPLDALDLLLWRLGRGD